MAATMKPRERVLAALNHQEPDRAPIDLGATTCTTLCAGAYKDLARALQFPMEARCLSLAFELIEIPPALLDRLPVDTRAVFGKPPINWQDRWLDKHTYVDEWGITFHRPEDWVQFDMIRHPLAEATTIDDIERHAWPDADDEGRVAGLRDHAHALREDAQYAVVGDMINTGIFEPSWYVRSMPMFLEDLLLRPQFATALLEKMCAVQMARFGRYLAEVGQYLDVVVVGDDLATQRGPVISPALYRRIVKPIQQKYFRFIKERTDARLWYHTCGNIVPLLDDLIEIGVDALNPVQVSAEGMDIRPLHARFGDRVTFWGAIDTQHLLPKGSPDEVRTAVRETISVLGKDGGYVLAPVHNVQDDVPASNLLAMLEEASIVRA